jgi:hypothetical protein
MPTMRHVPGGVARWPLPGVMGRLASSFSPSQRSSIFSRVSILMVAGEVFGNLRQLGHRDEFLDEERLHRGHLHHVTRP